VYTSASLNLQAEFLFDNGRSLFLAYYHFLICERELASQGAVMPTAPLVADDFLWLAPQAWVIYEPVFLGSESASNLQAKLRAELNWRQQPIRLFGRQVMQPRLIDFHGNQGTRYRYSGIVLEASGWPQPLGGLRDRLADEYGVRFNSVLCNLYRGGDDSMGWHSDAERELGRDPTVASVSLGSTRRFLIRPRGGGRSIEFRPQNGSLLLMGGDLQHHWQHQVPKTARAVGERINLTFRQVVTAPHR
jgi:alkylated DNA repair dioxygenase AlkB